LIPARDKPMDLRPAELKLGRPNNGGFLEREMGYWTDGKASGCWSAPTTGNLLSIDRCDRTTGSGVRRRGKADSMVDIRNTVRSTVISARGPRGRKCRGPWQLDFRRRRRTQQPPG